MTELKYWKMMKGQKNFGSSKICNSLDVLLAKCCVLLRIKKILKKCFKINE